MTNSVCILGKLSDPLQIEGNQETEVRVLSVELVGMESTGMGKTDVGLESGDIPNSQGRFLKIARLRRKEKTCPRSSGLWPDVGLPEPLELGAAFLCNLPPYPHPICTILGLEGFPTLPRCPSLVQSGDRNEQ